MQSNRQSDNQLQGLKTELDAWRTQQTGRKQIPQHFWDKAFELLNNYSIGAVSRELRLDYKRLKKHLLSSNNDIAQKSSTPPTFLELAASELAKSAQPTLHSDLHSDSLILPQAKEACRILEQFSNQCGQSQWTFTCFFAHLEPAPVRELL
jgi:uncharacterized membrane-anchored protein YhcB (DUF1043 family)